MSDTEISSDDDDEPTVKDLAARVRDLEADVYGYANGERSAGDEVIVDVKRSIVFLETRRLEDGDCGGIDVEDVYEVTEILGIMRPLAAQAYAKLRRRGEIYEPASGEVRTT